MKTLAELEELLTQIEADQSAHRRQQRRTLNREIRRVNIAFGLIIVANGAAVAYTLISHL